MDVTLNAKTMLSLFLTTYFLFQTSWFQISFLKTKAKAINSTSTRLIFDAKSYCNKSVLIKRKTRRVSFSAISLRQFF